jgi:hypothetical protein
MINAPPQIHLLRQNEQGKPARGAPSPALETAVLGLAEAAIGAMRKRVALDGAIAEELRFLIVHMEAAIRAPQEHEPSVFLRRAAETLQGLADRLDGRRA